MRKYIEILLQQKLVVTILTVIGVIWGMAVAPFDWNIDWLPRDPVPVDAIPNLGENQQIVFTDWPGRSPRDVEDQVTYPLTVALLGVPGVQEVRSLSMFGFSSVFVIFDENVEFYWSRSRLLEKLNSLPAGTLPDGVNPALGPDATALGQVYWYTLEGRDPKGQPVGGWGLQELRSIQDWFVRYALQSAEGVSEVASIGGMISEYLVEVNPDQLRLHGVSLGEVVAAVRDSNLDVGARSTEINRVEYLIRGVGFVRALEDIENAVVRSGSDNIPLLVRDVATVTRAPGERLGALTIGGAEAVGGVVVVREGYNPLQALRNVQRKIEELSPGMPSKAWIHWEVVGIAEVEAFGERHGLGPVSAEGLPEQESWLAWLRAHPMEDWPEWLTRSTVSIESFYDRTGLIHETLGTLNAALIQQILVTIIVVILMVMHLRAALVISAMLPLSVLLAFVLMKHFGVDANIVALAGIAIAIGTIVDMGIIVTENLLKHLREADKDEPRRAVVAKAVGEVGSAVITAISTTVVSFLPVFTMTGAEGKMFGPLAYTKTFVLLASVVVSLTVIPTVLYLLLSRQRDRGEIKERGKQGWVSRLPALIAAGLFTWLLTTVWEPLGPEFNFLRNLLFVVGVVGGLIGLFYLLSLVYPFLLRSALRHKKVFLLLPASIVLFGLTVWLGFERVFRWIPDGLEAVGGNREWVTHSGPWVWATHEFTGLGREFMPALDEGSFLWMPTTMPHASLGEALEVLQYQDQAIASVPEVHTVAGKIGRAETALDPAPVSMIETVILYHSEYKTDVSGQRLRFRYDRRTNEFVRDHAGDLIPDARGRPYRQWRDHIRSPEDIWAEIAAAAHLPGTTSAPRLQPIETRQVMLQTGMRAPMGVKVSGPDLETLDRMAVRFEELLRQVPQVEAATVNADRVVGKPYFELQVNREAIARYGLSVVEVQQTIVTAIGGEMVGMTVEGRERYPIRVRYPREMRNSVEDLEAVLVDTAYGYPVPLSYLAELRYVRGPQMIRSENSFPVAYVTFGGARGVAEVDVVEAVEAYLSAMLAAGELEVPAGVSWKFAGTYENQIRAAKTLAIVLPLSLAIIFMILYLQFRGTLITLIVFSSILVAWGGGFTMIYWYGQDWFLNFHVLGVNLRDLFQLQPINLSVAVWVGFLALFGIAVDDGVVMATYLRQSFEQNATRTVQEIREAAVMAGERRLRPCLMTTATTVLALLPVLTSTGRGADVMIPMALPTVGGMLFVTLSLFTVPVLYSWIEERKSGNSTENS